MSDYSKNLRRKAMVCQILSASLDFTPITIYGIIAFGQATTVQKLALSFMFILAIALTVINLLFKYSLRSTIWILLIGVYIALENIVPLLIIITVCTVLDEFIVSPLYKKFKKEYEINKEIDKRESIG